MPESRRAAYYRSWGCWERILCYSVGRNAGRFVAENPYEPAKARDSTDGSRLLWVARMGCVGLHGDARVMKKLFALGPTAVNVDREAGGRLVVALLVSAGSDHAFSLFLGRAQRDRRPDVESTKSSPSGEMPPRSTRSLTRGTA